MRIHPQACCRTTPIRRASARHRPPAASARSGSNRTPWMAAMWKSTEASRPAAPASRGGLPGLVEVVQREVAEQADGGQFVQRPRPPQRQTVPFGHPGCAGEPGHGFGQGRVRGRPGRGPRRPRRPPRAHSRPRPGPPLGRPGRRRRRAVRRRARRLPAMPGRRPDPRRVRPARRSGGVGRPARAAQRRRPGPSTGAPARCQQDHRRVAGALLRPRAGLGPCGRSGRGHRPTRPVRRRPGRRHQPAPPPVRSRRFRGGRHRA